jgi:transposase InsO family protein
MFDLTTFPPRRRKRISLPVVCVDHFTKYSWSVAVPDKESTTLYDCLYDLFTKFGVPTPQHFHFDNGGEFVNWAMDLVCQKINITQSTSMPRNPQCKGLVEERNKVSKRKVEQLVLGRGWLVSRNKGHTIPWIRLAEEVIMNENNSPCKTYNTLSPYFCFHNRPRDADDHQPLNSHSIAELHQYMYNHQKLNTEKCG